MKLTTIKKYRNRFFLRFTEGKFYCKKCETFYDDKEHCECKDKLKKLYVKGKCKICDYDDTVYQEDYCKFCRQSVYFLLNYMK